jgi:uncharacterized protein YjdB
MSLVVKCRSKRALFLTTILVILFWGCINNEQKADTFDLSPQFADSLSSYDRVLVILKDTIGNPLDTLFQGKVVSAKQLEGLSAPHYSGGTAVVSIIGYKNGSIVYNAERTYDGKTGEVVDVKPHILPTSRIKIGINEIRIATKTSTTLPAVTVEPENLTNKSLHWTSSNTAILKVEDGRLYGLKAGLASLLVRLESDTSKGDAVTVTVFTNPTIPDSVKLSPDTLRLAVGGRAGIMSVLAFPTIVPATVEWKALDTTIARIDQDGRVVGIKAGTTLLVATSKTDSAISDTGFALVSAPLPVQSVHLSIRSLTLFIGGAAESLSVQVEPADANPTVGFMLQDSSVAGLEGTRITGKKEGITWLKVYSLASPAKGDSIPVTVLSSQRVESVSISPDTVLLYTGGTAYTLAATVLPAKATAWIAWRSSDPSIATVDTAGRVKPVKAGRAIITVISKVDSGKKAEAAVVVKKDTPRLSVGRDTLISVGTSIHFIPSVEQDFGIITLFEWDLNGDGKWDSSSTSLKELDFQYANAKEVIAAFHVRDSEGNDTTVTRKIKAVAGPLIRILAPDDSAYFNVALIDVSWSVEGAVQTTFTKETLKEGPNTITRSAPDATGKIYSSSITVYLDTKAPTKPIVKGAALTNSLRPTWTWATGGGGNGVYRIRLDNEDLSSASATRDTTFTPPSELSAQAHTLYVQERDAAGNWSATSAFSIRIDVVPPATPIFDSLPVSPLNTLKPTWTWKSGGQGGAGVYRVKLDSSNLEVGGTIVNAPKFLAPLALTAAMHTLYIQEADSAGNFSPAVSKSVVLAPRETIGPAGFSPSTAFMTSLALDPNGTPYVAFQGTLGKAGVMRFNGATWENVGTPGFSTGAAGYPSLAISSTGVPYLAYVDAGNGGKATVMRFTGSAWQPVGTIGFSPGQVFYTSLALDRSDRPYIAFEDVANGQKLTVMKFNGNTWDILSSAGISSGLVSGVTLKISATGNPYVAFSDGTRDNKLSVVRYNGNSFDYLGDPGITPGGVYGLALAIDSTGSPYVAFADQTNANKGSVLKYSGTAWVSVGSAGFSLGETAIPSLMIGRNGMPYLAFIDVANGSKASVARFNGTSWQFIGAAGITPGTAYDLSMALDKNDVPYISFRDEQNGSKATVMRTSFDP